MQLKPEPVGLYVFYPTYLCYAYIKTNLTQSVISANYMYCELDILAAIFKEKPFEIKAMGT